MSPSKFKKQQNVASQNLKNGWPRLKKRNNSLALLCNFSEAVVLFILIIEKRGQPEFKKWLASVGKKKQQQLNEQLNEAIHNLKSGWPALGKRNKRFALLCNFSNSWVFCS